MDGIEHPNQSAHDIPEGFRPLRAGGGFIAANGPLYARLDDAGPVFGVRIEARHCNPLLIAHGGFMSTLADMVLPMSVRGLVPELRAHFLLTVSLSIDFLGQAPIGAWVEGRGQVLKQTKRMVFGQCLLTVGSNTVLRASGIMRIGPTDPHAGE